MSVCVCSLSHISPPERLFVLKILSRQWRSKNCGFFSLKLLSAPLQRSRTPSFERPYIAGHFPAESMHAHYSIYHVVELRILHLKCILKCFSGRELLKGSLFNMLLILGAHAQRGLLYLVCVRLFVCVCLSV